jgi:polysaccharide biosynthesis/export protein
VGVLVKSIWSCLLLVLLCLGGCTASPGGLLETGDRYSVQSSQVEDYRLGVGDKVRLTVFNEPTLSGEFSVSANGTLSLPLVGDIDAVGKSPVDIGKAAQAKLADGYLREPQVSVEVTAYRPFFILGEVKSPGQYPYVSGLTVFNAVATAEGFTPRAEKKVAYVRRSGSATEEPYRLTPDLRVWPGDTIRIGERYF